MNNTRKFTFFKYQGTGNDFILIDNRQNFFPRKDKKLIRSVCERKFGVGADGLILLENDTQFDFKMVYYNSDGNESTMCGNGGRCVVAFAKLLGIIGPETVFMAVDGKHKATIVDDVVTLQMIDVTNIRETGKYFYLNTGSPHHVQLVPNLDTLDVQKEGAKIRYGIYGEEGSNINFVNENDSGSFDVRTYERGVEGETLSCGTGVTAVALAMHRSGKTKKEKVKIKTVGGNLEVSFAAGNASYTDVKLTGTAKMVFKGEMEW
ncbi:diaminopimelate epimerase [Croceitalea sp. MTPC5]|uniref:diaminopimelate epimerase n=1 Tax=Croceitalea sp. MTPC5 TaxID=3056565 RepID=UPI002B3C6FA4|nr:diaminopimelate epimerase [Croceitalea sp. MTPC5]